MRDAFFREFADEVAAVEPARDVAERIDHLTKPLGSLGALERLAIRLAAISPLPKHGYAHRAVIIGAADHGVADEGVSAYPAEVTAQMVIGFLRGTAAINAIARTTAADVYVANFGVRGDIPRAENLLDMRVGPGTNNFARGPAMSIEQCAQAIDAGRRTVADVCARKKYELVALGEMGIGNTTSAAALTAALTQTPPSLVTGRGTGIDDAILAKKIAVVEAAVASVAKLDTPHTLAEIGGFEILGLAGAMIELAKRRIPILLDGFISTAAALAAAALVPTIRDYYIATHRSVEPGHTLGLAALGLVPLLDLDMRLGEGSGAALAFPLCDAAARIVGEMLTFEEAGVAGTSISSAIG